MRLIGEEGLDLAILPIGDYYTMGPDDAVRAVKLLAPEYVLPIHYNTFPPIVQDAAAWAERVRQETSAEPVVLEPGGWFDIGVENRAGERYPCPPFRHHWTVPAGLLLMMIALLGTTVPAGRVEPKT